MKFSKFLKYFYSVVTISMLPFLGGCAFGTRSVTLKNSESISSNDKTHHNHEICFNGLSDVRKDSTIGHVQNGYGVKTADVVSLNSVPNWVNTEIRTQLENCGYIVNENCASNGNNFLISGKIVKVYTTAYWTYLGEVTIKTSITRDSSEILNKTYTGYNKAGTNWAATAQVFGTVLEASLKSAVNQLVKDIDSLDDKTYAEKTTPDNGAKTISEIPVSDTSAKIDTLAIPKENGGFAIIRGKRNLSSIRFLLDSIKTEFKSVYHDRFELDSTISGDICVSFIITSDGYTKFVKIVRNSLNDKPIQEKLISSLSGLRFDKIADNSETEILYNLSFKAESAKSSKRAVAATLGVLAAISAVISILTMIHTLNSVPTY
jgi:hypothetical protein